MALVRVIIKQQQLSNLVDRLVGQDLERRAKNVLQKAKETVPRASGDFANSLRIVKTTQRGNVIVRITSNDPQVVQIRKGTQGRSGTANVDNIQQWMQDKGIPASRSQAYRMARSIASHGTPQAGTFSNNKVEDALKAAVLEARK